MALTPQEQQRLNDLLREGIKLAKQLNDTQQEASFQNFTGSLTDAERLVDSLRQEWNEYTRDVAGTALNFQRIVDEIKDMNSGVKRSQQAFSGLNSLAQKLQSHQEGISKLSSKEIKDIQKKVKNKVNELNITKQLLEDQLAQQNLSDEERNKAQSALDNVNQSLNNNTSALNQFNEQLKVAAKDAKNLEDALGLGGNALKGMQGTMSKMGLSGLADKLGLDEANEAMEEMANQLTDNGKKAASLGDKFKIAGAGMKAAFSGLAKNLLGPEVLIGELVSALQSSDQAAGELAKSMNLTYKEALNTRREFGNMAALSGDAALNTRALQETYMAIGKELGSNARLNKEDLITFTKLREQAGYTNEQLASIQKLSLVNGKSLEQNTKEILGGAKAYASRKGLVINEKQVLDDVAKASATLKLSLGGSADALAKSVVQARAVGLSLEQAAAMSESLLNFESSIENELSAELLTGKDLNFEKARTLALNNDIAGAAEEIANQVGSSADFAKMNAIQQESIAKAAGLTREQLAQSLMDREALQKLSGVEGKDAKEKFNNLVKQVGMEEAKRRLGDEQLANQFAQQSVQERFNQSVEKLKELFVQVAEPILAIISPLANLISTILPAINVLMQPIIWAVQLLSDAFTKVSELITSSTPALVTFGTVLSGILVTQQAIAFQKKQGWLYDTYSYAMKQKDVVLTNLQAAKEMFLGNAKKKGFFMTLAEAAMTAFKSVASIPIIGPVLGAAAAAAAVGLGYSLLKGNDILSQGDGSSGYGKRTLFGPEGAIQLNNKDTVIAGTDLFGKGDDVVPEPGKSPQIFGKNVINEKNQINEINKTPDKSISVSNKTAPTPQPDTNALLIAEMKRGNDQRAEQLRLQKRDTFVSTIRVQ